MSYGYVYIAKYNGAANTYLIGASPIHLLEDQIKQLNVIQEEYAVVEIFGSVDFVKHKLTLEKYLARFESTAGMFFKNKVFKVSIEHIKDVYDTISSDFWVDLIVSVANSADLKWIPWIGMFEVNNSKRIQYRDMKRVLMSWLADYDTFGILKSKSDFFWAHRIEILQNTFEVDVGDMLQRMEIA
jgi:hypothetical protein